MPDRPSHDAIRYGRFAMLREDLYARSPDSRRRVAERLAEVRTSQDVTQVQLAATIGTTQSAVSRIERQNDLLVSTLREYVAATGGRLRLFADYGDHHVEFTIAFEIEIESEDSDG
jgi:transcriptional regulator with XRE-family HTH domain